MISKIKPESRHYSDHLDYFADHCQARINELSSVGVYKKKLTSKNKRGKRGEGGRIYSVLVWWKSNVAMQQLVKGLGSSPEKFWFKYCKIV